MMDPLYIYTQTTVCGGNWRQRAEIPEYRYKFSWDTLTRPAIIVDTDGLLEGGGAKGGNYPIETSLDLWTLTFASPMLGQKPFFLSILLCIISARSVSIVGKVDISISILSHLSSRSRVLTLSLTF